MNGNIAASGIIRRFLPWLLLCAAVFIFYGRILTGEMLFGSDTLVYQMPEKFFIRECLLRGSFPWLNPYILCGEDMLSNIDAGLFNPLNVLLLAGTPLFGYGLFVFVHYLLAAFSMYVFFRKGFGYYRSVAFCGAIAYSCGGHLWSMNGNGFYRCGWLIPLFFLFLLELYRSEDLRRGIRFLILSSFALALLFCCGNFYEAYFSVCFALAALLFAAPETARKKGFPAVLRGGGLFILPLALAVVLALPQLLASYEAAVASPRAEGIPYVEAALWSFPPLRGIEYLAPFFFGARQGNGLMSSLLYEVPSNLKWLGIGSSPWADAVFIGMPLILFLMPAIFCVKRGNRYFFIVSAIVFSLLAAMGRHAPLFEILRHVLPGFSMFRHPEKFIFWPNFFLLAASCAGMQAVLKGGQFPRKVFLVSCRTFIALALAGILLTAVFYYSGGTGWMEGKTEWGRTFMFKWQIFSLLFPAIIAGAAALIYAGYGKALGATAAGLLYFQAFVYSQSVQWTVPSEFFGDVKPWTAYLPKFNRDNWRIMPCELAEKPLQGPDAKTETAGKFRDPYISKQFAAVSSLKYNTPVYFHLRSPMGFSPLCPKKYMEYMDFSLTPPPLLADAVSARYISVSGISKEIPGGDKICAVLPVGEKGKMFSILENINARPRIEVMPLPGKPGDGSPAAVSTDDLPGSITVRVKGPAILILREKFYKGWTCRDGKGNRKEIIPYDRVFMSVACGNEDERLTFTYAPPAAGTIKYSMAVAAAMLLAMLMTLKKRASNPAEKG